MAEEQSEQAEVPAAKPAAAEPAAEAAPAAPSGRWSVGASLAVAAALPVFVMFFLPWHRVLGGLDFAEPKVLLTVRGLDRARGIDLPGQVLNTPIGYQQLGQGEQKPITPAALGVIRIETNVGDARPILWFVPVLAAAVLGLGLLQSLTRTQWAMSLAMTICATGLAGLLIWDAGWFGLAAAGADQKGGAYIVTSETALPLEMSVWTALGAVACGILSLVLPGRRPAAEESPSTPSGDSAAPSGEPAAPSDESF